MEPTAPVPSQSLIEAIDRLRVVAESIFNIPEATHLAAVWSAGFILPMVAFTAAYAVGKLVSTVR